MTRETRVFPAMGPVVDALDEHGIPWGIVTNKVTRLAVPIIQALGLAARTAVLIGGDTTPHAKPHPEPLLEAARRVRVPPEACVYVGDDHRDVQAGRAAGMRTVAVRFGYLNGSSPDLWGADVIVSTPAEIENII